jgi:ribosomal protein L37E
MTPKRPTLPEGTDPVAALRQLQQQLAEARPTVRTEFVDREQLGYDHGCKDAERTAGMNLAPIVDAVEALVDSLREQLRKLDPFDGPGATEPAWYGSVWLCPVADCEWAHREENAVSSTDPVAAERVRTALVGHLGDHGSQQPHQGIVNALAARVFDWPAHCSEWIAGSDPENPDMCPEYASPDSDKCALHDPRQVEYAAELMARQGWLSPSQAAELRDAAHRLRVERFADSGFPVPSQSGYVHPAEALNLLHGGSPDATPQCPGLQGDGNPFTLPQRCARCGRPANYHPEILQAVRDPITYPEPTLTADPAEAKPRARVAYPPVSTEWRYGFPPKGTATMWRCQRCGTNHEGNPPGCLHCGYTVLDPGHWVALPPAGTEA